MYKIIYPCTCRAWRLFLFAAIVLLNPALLKAQSDEVPSFSGRAVPSGSSRNQLLSEQFRKVSVYQFPTHLLETAIQHPDYQGNLVITLGQEHHWQMELEPAEIRSPDYRMVLLTEGGAEERLPGPPITFRGRLKGPRGGEARLTVSGDFLYGFVEEGGKRWFIEPLRRFDPQADAQQYTVYAASDVKPGAPMACGVTDMQTYRRNEDPGQNGTPVPEMGGCRKTELAIACDYSMLVRHGDVGNLVAYTLGVMNNVSGDYTGQFNDDVAFEVVVHYLATCPDCDFLTPSTNASSLLNSFVNWGNGGNFGKPYDLAQFWTHRDLDGSTIGIAYLGVVCNSFRYHVLQDFQSSNAALTRVLVSHEIGHNFNASHDAAGSPTIMAPAVNNTSAWSSSSISSISTHISTRSCLDPCSPMPCPEVTGLKITGQSAGSISLRWDANSAGSYRVRLRPEGSNSWTFSQLTTQTTYSISSLSPCTFYEVQVSSACNGSYGPDYTLYFSTSKLELISVNPLNCQNGAYDLEVQVAHGGSSGNFELVVDGKIFPIAYASSPQTVLLSRVQPNNGRSQVQVVLREPGSANGTCYDEAFYDAPGPRCDCISLLSEDFNSSCGLPAGWTSTSSSNTQYRWRFDDASRTVVNYPNGTIDGTCMAFFDDDINSSASYAGTITLTTPVVDLTGYEDLSLSFDYDFHAFVTGKGGNSSYFRVEIWDGNAWQSVLYVSGTENCSWSGFWSCPPPRFSVSLDTFRSAAFQVRFIYSDGNAWAGAVGLDNIEICGHLPFSPPTALPVLEGVYIADREQTDGAGWTHYWKQAATAPATPDDLLLLSIRKNSDATLMLSPADIKVGVTAQGGVVDLGYYSGAPAPYADSAKNWFVMNRYWDVSPEVQPTGPVQVRFYYRDADFAGLQNAVAATGGTLPAHADLELFKFDSGSGVDPDPMARPTPHAGGSPSNFIALSHSHRDYFSNHLAEFTVSGFSGGGAGSSLGSVNANFPLEIIRFEGWQEQHQVRLEWTTVDELFSSHFDVQRSVDGLFFNTIGEVESQGANAGGNDYAFIDPAPLPGRAYYRLRQVELNGQTDYSPVLIVHFSLERDGLAQVFPNPVGEQLHIVIENRQAESAELTLYDRTGREMLRRSWRFQIRSHEKVDSEFLLPGLYYYHLRVGDRNTYGKLLKR